MAPTLNPNPNNNPRRWASVKEAAAYLKLGRFTTYRLIKSGRLPAVRLGSRIRVDLGRVDELLDSGALGTSENEE